MLVPSSVCAHLLYQRLGTVTYWNATGMQSLRDVCPTSSARQLACYSNLPGTVSAHSPPLAELRLCRVLDKCAAEAPVGVLRIYSVVPQKP